MVPDKQVRKRVAARPLIGRNVGSHLYFPFIRLQAFLGALLSAAASFPPFTLLASYILTLCNCRESLSLSLSLSACILGRDSESIDSIVYIV